MCNDMFRWIEDDDCLQNGGHTVQFYEREAAIRNASILTNKAQSNHIAEAINRDADSEEVFEYSQNAVKSQFAQENNKKLKEWQKLMSENDTL